MAAPAYEPVTERILADVEAALGSISTKDQAVEYWNDVRSVVRYQAGVPSITFFPTLVIVQNGTEVQDDLSADQHSINEERLSLTITAYMETRSDVPRAHSRMARDIRTALMQDPERGVGGQSGEGNAVHTFIEGFVASYAPEVTDPHSEVSVDVSILYRTDVDDLETSR
jgi:hypothetical protein